MCTRGERTEPCVLKHQPYPPRPPSCAHHTAQGGAAAAGGSACQGQGFDARFKRGRSIGGAERDASSSWA